jgi:3-oxoacyl-[acyl-carrier protein] reductase
MMKQYQLDGMTVLVTGGSRGIGAAVVEAAARAGADVAFSWVSARKQADGVAERARELGGRCVGYRSDVADPGQAARMVSAVEADYGRLDGLVNNAGIMPISPFLEMDLDEWDRVLKTDLYGPYYVCRSVLPEMTARGKGSIVNLSSRLGQVGAVDLAHYCAAKAGVIGLTKALAREFGSKGIRVNAVAPGPTWTDMGATGMDGDVGRRRLAELPLGRFCEPSEVADAVIFLLSDAASLFTGQTLNPNAGGYMP